MDTFTGNWSYPTKVAFGVGRVAELAGHVRDAGGTRPLVVTDAGLARTPVLPAVTAALEGMPFVVFEGVHPNPVEADVYAGVETYREAEADCVVAVGGGSPLDVGKLIALMATHEPPMDRYDDAKGGDAHIGPDVPPIVAIPTTAGTGSEVGRAGVVTLESTGLKTVIFSPYLLPRLALSDPELTVGLPPFLTAATGMDALTHCAEAWMAPGFHPMADGIALAGMELVAEHLPRAVADGTDLAARAAMLAAATMGATAFQKGLGVCHSLAHPLSAVAAVQHGLANAVLLPHVLVFNAVAVPERVARMGRILGDPEGDAAAAVRRLNEELGLPASLSETGVGEGLIPELVEQAVVDACQLGNPRSATRADLEALYRAAM